MNNYRTGARAFDVNNNEVLWTYNCGVKFSLSEGNVRAMRNRYTNVFMGLAVQPVYGGPAYFIRNVVVNPSTEQMKFHALDWRPPFRSERSFRLQQHLRLTV